MTIGYLLSLQSFSFAQTNTDGYCITGIIDGLADGSNVYLIRLSKTNQPDTISSSLVQQGQFQLRGKLDLEGELLYVRLDSIYAKKSVLIFAVNAPITLTGNLSNWPTGVSVQGSPPHNDYLEQSILLDAPRKRLQDIQGQLLEIQQKVNNARVESPINVDTLALKRTLVTLEQQYNRLKATYYQVWDEFQRLHPNSLYTPKSIMNRRTKSVYEKEAAYNELSSHAKNSFYGQALKEIIDEQKMKLTIKVGGQALDFVSTTPNGQTLALKEVISKSKLVLVDFWGSWCKPCRKETPYIRRVYENFKEKGFNVLSVSLEFNSADWKKAIEEDNMSWLHVSELKGREETAAKLYSINGVPAYVLIDASGTIIAVDLPGSGIPISGQSLRGDDLYQTIANLLGD